MVDHPLAMDVEAMRRTGYAAVDALVARLADPEADPVLRRASPEEMRSRLGGPPPEQGAGLDAVLARVIEDVLPYAHFGELAARDGGGGYGYTRLATVRCAEPGRLLRLSNADFQWLVATQPAVRAGLAAILAERLQER